MTDRIKRFIHIILLLVMVLTTSSCTHQGQSWKKMDKADELMNTKPDSALAILQGIPTSDIEGKEASARYALLKSMALDKNCIDTTTFDILQPAIDYYLGEGTPNEQLRTLYYQGRIYQNQGNDDSAMRCFMQGREFYKKSTDTLTTANLMVALATIQYSIYQFNEFIDNNLESAKLYKAIGRTDYEILNLMNALDGCILNQDKHLADSVMSIVQERIAKNPKFESIATPYKLSYALEFGNKKDITDILNHLESSNFTNDIDKLDLVEAYCKIGNASYAKQIFDSIHKTPQILSSLKYLSLKPYVLELSGDYAGALHAYKKFSATIDSIHMNIFSHDLLFARQRHEAEKLNLIEKQKKGRIIWSCICVTFILLIVTCYIYYRFKLEKIRNKLEVQERKKLLLEQENLEKDKKRLEAEQRQRELETANLKLEIAQLENERDGLKELQERQSELAKPIQDIIMNRLNILNGLLAKEITNNESYAEPYNKWIETICNDKNKFMKSIRIVIAASRPKFLEYLEQHGLSDDEINYLCLYTIGLRGKEVGEYIQSKRHYIISHEIRKKLGMSEHETNIGPYIRKLMKSFE